MNSLRQYQLQRRHHNNGFSQFMNANFHGAPTYSQALLMSAVGKALDAELFYSSDVFAFVKQELNGLISESVLSAGKDASIRTENGHFGMDIYYCRKALEVIRSRRANKEALNHWNLKIGSKIKNFQYGTHKFATLTLLAIDDKEGCYTFECTKRGSRRRWTLSISANAPSFSVYMKNSELSYLHISTSNGITTAIYDQTKAYIAQQRFCA